MFKFNFEQTDTNASLSNEITSPQRSKEKSKLDCTHLNYDILSFSSVDISSSLSLKVRDLFDIQLDCINSSDHELHQLIKQNSDIIPSQYEGGLKVWECTFDLVKYLSILDFTGKSVLDLGCGSGLAGIICLLKGSALVDFHDFNDFVLKQFTIPNILLNLNHGQTVNGDEFQVAQPIHLERTSFYYGDWDLFENEGVKYDFIVTSETIYTPESYGKIAQILDYFLTGTCILACKRYYFGCGGGAVEFCSYLQVNYKDKFECKCVSTISDNVPREIWYITKIK